MTVIGVRASGSLGVVRYVDRLAGALALLGVDYRADERPQRDSAVHLHLANSSRAVALRSLGVSHPYLLTVHDVVPRTPLLRPVYRTLVNPMCVRRAAHVVVHSRFAADLLARVADVPARRMTVVPHAATPAPAAERAAARASLGLPGDSPLAVLPGVLKSAKLVEEAVRAATPLLAAGRLRLALVGRVQDPRLVSSLPDGAHVLADPDDDVYTRAMAAAHVVMCLRSESVGETNGPLLDAIGAGRAILATPVGSIPEVAGDCARLVDPTAEAIRAGLEAMLDDGERREREAAAALRAREYTWEAAAHAHRELLEEVAA